MTANREFGLRDHSGLVRQFDEAKRPQFGLFYNLFRDSGRYRPIDAPVAAWDEIIHRRHLAPVVGESSPHPFEDPYAKKARSTAMIHIKQATTIPPSELFWTRMPGQANADPRGVIAEKLAGLATLIMNTREYLFAQALLGSVVVSTTTVPGSDQAFTLTFGNNTYAKSNAWSTAGTKVVSAEILALLQDHVQSCGMPGRLAITNDVVLGNIQANTEVQAMAVYKLGAEQLRTSLAGEILSEMRLGGLDWLVSYDGYVPKGGSFTRFLEASGSTDRVVVLPDRAMLGDVLQCVEGRAAVPSSGAGYDAEAGLAGLSLASPGWYAYSYMLPEASGIRVCAGWVGTPIVAFPAAVTVADVN